ncbi:hypothetical protein KV102_05330 [Mumia sp. zg.B53]|uniref:hypothetical protein n=1 Tax=unclassified Mumia TaxID=2621872 RepID=UPI001C6ECDA0|nr:MULTISPECIES: hypothetical protein [unclassified Mumia]MBW9204360.1 hypothetical protein [Mumia sp. zg.B17]MBW9209655.1 hypothetical protein [Mumia sp. zg.B21]MBW9214259.1 hypothetical protein [Mumia sp. zg.B53]MDD9348059.1 hypothetical protein [Mumia sp.]
MNEYTHLLLTNMRERELTRRLEQREHLGTTYRPSLRNRTARTLHRVADRLDGQS